LALTSEEQELCDFALAALPEWFSGNPRLLEDTAMFAKTLGQARAIAVHFFSQTLIGQATGASATEPDWLNLHARDRGTSRVLDEADADLRTRLQNIEDAVTRPALLTAVGEVAGGSGGLGMVELRRDRAYFGTFTARTGTGGTFATVSGTLRSFTPTVAFPLPVEVGFARSGAQDNPRLTFSGAADSDNNGQKTVTALSGNAAIYTQTNPGNGADASVLWTLSKWDVDGGTREGFGRAYLSRGYRMGVRGMVLILPYGTTATEAAAATDLLRQKKAAGVLAHVERRTSP
jgi:hypothetical protein